VLVFPTRSMGTLENRPVSDTSYRPSSLNSLALSASGNGKMPMGTVEAGNDYGTNGFGDASPPPGVGPPVGFHRACVGN
jgi:hypothetical protein